MSISKIEAIKRYFSTPDKPMENTEIIQLVKANKKDFDELGEQAVIALGETLNEN